MKKRRSWRIPLGFLAGGWFIWAAKPTLPSILGGMCVMMAGETIRFVSAGTLKKRSEVTRTGIYAYTRNPLYIGSFLLGAGACIIGKDLVFSVVFVLSYLLFYRRVIDREERFLLGRHGDEYERYRAEVPRIFPRHIALTPLFSAVSLSQALKNREGRTILGIVFVIAVMFLKLRYPF
jgi:protein-S-isoprenylcysteine O-methyltransferase Ste14